MDVGIFGWNEIREKLLDRKTRVCYTQPISKAQNEIAQSEAAFGQTFVKYWLHNGFVNINHEKMSKSLGNFLMVKDITKKYHPEAVRLFLLSHHWLHIFSL